MVGIHIFQTLSFILHNTITHHITPFSLYKPTFLKTSLAWYYSTPLTLKCLHLHAELIFICLLLLLFFCMHFRLDFQCSLGTILTSPPGFMSSSAQPLCSVSLFFMLWFVYRYINHNLYLNSPR